MDKLSKVIKQIEENELLDKDEIVNQLKEINRQATVTFKKNEIELAELIIARIDKTYKRFGATLEDIYTIVSDDEMRRWIGTNANITKCFFASKYGYEVEKEPLYVMPVPHVSYPVHYCVEDDHISFRQGNAQKFTQAELDKYFPDIKQFAVPVDEVEG